MFVQSSGLMNRLFANVCPGRKSRTMSVHLEFFMSESNLQNIFHGKLLASNLKMLKLHIRPEVGGLGEKETEKVSLKLRIPLKTNLCQWIFKYGKIFKLMTLFSIFSSFLLPSISFGCRENVSISPID